MDYVASRGEYLNGILLSSYLGFEFVDPADVIFFNKDGVFDEVRTDAVLPKRLKDLPNAVVPGFYGRAADGSVKTFSRGGSDITGSIWGVIGYTALLCFSLLKTSSLARSIFHAHSRTKTKKRGDTWRLIYLDRVISRRLGRRSL